MPRLDQSLDEVDAHFDWCAQLMTHGGLKVFCLFLLLLFFFLETLRELLLDLDGGLVDKDSDCWLTLPCLLTPGDFKEVMLCKFLKNFILTNHATIKQSTI